MHARPTAGSSPNRHPPVAATTARWAAHRPAGSRSPAASAVQLVKRCRIAAAGRQRGGAWRRQRRRMAAAAAGTLGRKVLKPRMSSVWPLNRSLTFSMTPVVSILQAREARGTTALQPRARSASLRSGAPRGPRSHPAAAGQRVRGLQAPVAHPSQAAAASTQHDAGPQALQPPCTHVWALNCFMISRKLRGRAGRGRRGGGVGGGSCPGVSTRSAVPAAIRRCHGPAPPSTSLGTASASAVGQPSPCSPVVNLPVVGEARLDLTQVGQGIVGGEALAALLLATAARQGAGQGGRAGQGGLGGALPPSPGCGAFWCAGGAAGPGRLGGQRAFRGPAGPPARLPAGWQCPGRWQSAWWVAHPAAFFAGGPAPSPSRPRFILGRSLRPPGGQAAQGGRGGGRAFCAAGRNGWGSGLPCSGVGGRGDGLDCCGHPSWRPL